MKVYVRRTALLLVLAAIAGCGGGGGEEDSLEPLPTVTLTASDQTIEGGTYVVLTAAAHDAQDVSLTPTLSCSQGTVQGSMLLTPVVTANTTITCTATATNAAGRSASAQVAITVTATAAALELPEELATVAAGQTVVLFGSNLPLSEESYPATFGGTAVTLRNNGAGVLSFTVPAATATGASNLSVTVASRPYDFPLQITAAPVVEDPKAVVRATLEAGAAELQRIHATYAATLAPAQLEALERQQAAAADALLQLDGISGEQLREVAVTLVADGLATGSSSTGGAAANSRVLAQSAAGMQGRTQAQAFKPAECWNATKTLARDVKNIVVAGTLGGLGLEAVVVGPDPVSRVAGAALAIGGFVYIWKKADEEDAGTYLSLSSLRNACFEEDAVTLANGSSEAQSGWRAHAQSVRALAASTRLGFANDVARSFRPQSHLHVHEDYLGQVQDAFSRLTAALTSLPFQPAAIANLLQELVTEKTEDVSPSELGLGGVTSTGAPITGTLAGDGELVKLRFKVNEDSNDAKSIDFTFVLNRSGHDPVPFESTLSVDLPEASDAALEVIQGTPTAASVTTVGADTLEVLTAPAYGSVVLQNDGSFVYTPSGQYFGADQFTYRAVNENGHSAPATVAVNVKRKFDGAWQVSIDRTLHSSVPEGICEDEADSTETHYISKVSDTLYQLNYMGVVVNLEMASADSASGPSGSKSVTYPDGPEDKGSTTETLTLSIPDSTHLNGTLFWNYSYSGTAGNHSCNGSSVITGTRPVTP